jgi:hypothetical protein
MTRRPSTFRELDMTQAIQAAFAAEHAELFVRLLLSFSTRPGDCTCGRRSRDKGARSERSIVHGLQATGIAAVRVPLSGAVGGRYAGDIVLPLMGRDLCVEVKARADGFRELYSWLNERDMLIIKADRQEPVVVRSSLAAEVAKGRAA